MRPSWRSDRRPRTRMATPDILAYTKLPGGRGGAHALTSPQLDDPLRPTRFASAARQTKMTQRMKGAALAADRPLGILMLDTRFPRIVGDIGNAETFPFPVIYQTLEGLGPSDAVAASPDRPRIRAVLAANAKSLAEKGAVGISTSCGFLALFQQALAMVSPVPVATSALMLVPMMARTLPGGRRVGVITASRENLTAAHLAAVDASRDTPVEGMPPNGSFARTFLANGTELDRDEVERETLLAGRRLVARHPDVGAVVLECTNLPPYAPALRRDLGLPVYDVTDLLRLFHAGLKRG